ncbi:hypothetical protein V5O48_000920 [Marasmius crinis-equi]|uniref:RNA-dependent RNA polymerase n=1 Tax=Marasmius crinis-equi TaxID=585013 RepID=A0ABR3G0H0_9AGAR
MDITIRSLPYSATVGEVKKILAEKILHNPQFQSPSADGRRINFAVELEPNEQNPTRNNGSGCLTLPTIEIGSRFLDTIQGQQVEMEGRKLRFYPLRRRRATDADIVALQSMTYEDPTVEEDRLKTLYDLSRESLLVDAAHLGVFASTTSTRGKQINRCYSVEWKGGKAGRLEFDYDKKAFRVLLGESISEATYDIITVNLTNIQKIEVCDDFGRTCIFFDNSIASTFERGYFYPSLTGNPFQDSRKVRDRIASLDDAHERIAPYCHKLMVTLHDGASQTQFLKLCQTAQLARSLIRPANVEVMDHRVASRKASLQSLFSLKAVGNIQQNIRRFEKWPITFQLESLLTNGLLHPRELDDLLPHIQRLYESTSFDSTYVVNFLRIYKLEVTPFSRQLGGSPIDIFTSSLRSYVHGPTEVFPEGTFSCHHITFTPTKKILDGPYPTQENRAIRLYKGHEENFVRVYFRDEDESKYRVDWEVEEKLVLEDRVGNILKKGFDVGGRHFEFLGYSNSSLGENTVWFVSPFDYRDPENGRTTLINAETIRDALGNFRIISEEDYVGQDEEFGFYKKDLALLRQPSKLAARIALSFTASSRSVNIRSDEWEIVPDLKCGNQSDTQIFTDGIGTISQALGNRIWAELKRHGADRSGRAVQPSAYKIRFLGFKGMVSVDKELDKTGGNIQMRLRPSMRKFAAKDSKGVANIEIAQWYGRPGVSHLNKALVMILEFLGVTPQSFLDLTDEAIRATYKVHESLSDSSEFMADHGFGFKYDLAYVLTELEKLGGQIKDLHDGSGSCINNQFLALLCDVGEKHVLREIMHDARILIPRSHHVVGVADEGPAYRDREYDNVFCLEPGQIYVCIQKADDPEPTYLEGPCSITRSPITHPGDVQRVQAIGKPPADQLCLFAHLKNVVVLPCAGKMSPTSSKSQNNNISLKERGRLLLVWVVVILTGIDEFDIISIPELLPATKEAPASYPSVKAKELTNRNSNIEDVCDFVVEYIRSDVIGILSSRLLVIADQSQHFFGDKKCAKLAELCSRAVDYSKHGNALDLHGEDSEDRIPGKIIRCDPDWNKSEVVKPRKTDYYESRRALGHMYRKVAEQIPEDNKLYKLVDAVYAGQKECPNVVWDPVSYLLEPKLQKLGITTEVGASADDPNLSNLLGWYRDELRFICTTYPLTNIPGARLLEAEVVMGTILTRISDRGMRKGRIWQMGFHVGSLVERVRNELECAVEGLTDQEKALRNLTAGWKAWRFAATKAGLEDNFGANSLALLVLGSLLKNLEKLEKPTAQN